MSITKQDMPFNLLPLRASMTKKRDGRSKGSLDKTLIVVSPRMNSTEQYDDNDTTHHTIAHGTQVVLRHESDEVGVAPPKVKAALFEYGTPQGSPKPSPKPSPHAIPRIGMGVGKHRRKKLHKKKQAAADSRDSTPSPPPVADRGVADASPERHTDPMQSQTKPVIVQLQDEAPEVGKFTAKNLKQLRDEKRRRASAKVGNVCCSCGRKIIPTT